MFQVAAFENRGEDDESSDSDMSSVGEVEEVDILDSTWEEDADIHPGLRASTEQLTGQVQRTGIVIRNGARELDELNEDIERETRWQDQSANRLTNRLNTVQNDMIGLDIAGGQDGIFNAGVMLENVAAGLWSDWADIDADGLAVETELTGLSRRDDEAEMLEANNTARLAHSERQALVSQKKFKRTSRRRFEE